MDSWGDLRKILLPVLLIMLVTTVIVMVCIRICNAIYYASQNKEKAA